MKLPVRPDDTPEIFAARYGLTTDELKALNAADLVEIDRALTAVGDARKIVGVPSLDIGDPLTKLNRGLAATPVPALARGFEYFDVTETRTVGTLGLTKKETVIEYLVANPAATPTKRIFPGNYTLVLSTDSSTVYWRRAITLNLQSLTQGPQVAPDLVNGLDPGRNWYQVESRDPPAVANAKLLLTPDDYAGPTKRFEDKDYTLVFHAGELYWSRIPDVLGAETNPDYDWLLYETRANVPVYRKEKAALAYGLFAVPLDHRAEVVASNDMPDILAQAFFPGMSVAEVQAISNQSCRWRDVATTAIADGPNSMEQQMSARTTVVIYAPRMMIMPYNYYANDVKSYSIGTEIGMDIVPGPTFRLKKVWPLWETASRSSVSRLVATTPDDLAVANRYPNQWTFRSKTPPAGELAPEYKDQIFKLGTLTDCYSVKTGVRWLGKNPQGSEDPGGGKDVLESNALLASMRSDWIEYVEEAIGQSDFLIVLRELLTVTFPNVQRKTRDGYQIRDLRPLDPAMIYFPPLSIPFAGQAFVDAYNLLHPGATVTFEGFWQDHYAKAVGKAKAELLLRYGLQLTTPNPQNFLLEFRKGTLEPTGKVVIRDIGDAKLHSEVIGQIGADHPAIQYELTNPSRPGYLPAQTNNLDRHETPEHAATHERFDNYPLNTRVHWHQYSSFKQQYGGSELPRQTFTTLDWGRAHYKAYVDHLADTLADETIRVPVFGQAAYDRLLAAVEVKNKSKSDSAKKILAEARKTTAIADITPTIYESVFPAGPFVQNDALNAEWALEVHTDELLHELLCTPEMLAKVKAHWV